MTLVATSLKLPAALKRRLARLAKRSGESPHALMVRALAQHAEAAERRATFEAEALQADAAMERSGAGYAMEDVHRYFTARAGGAKPRRPRPERWRR